MAKTSLLPALPSVLSLFGTTFLCLSLSAATARGADLASQQARPSPAWLTRGVIYQIWLRGFTQEGTLVAATKRLPEVAALGADILYLGPICLADDDMRQEFWSTRQKASGTNNPRNPYRMKDYNRIDPEYGTENDFREFVATAHRLNMKVMMDLVYYHCGPTSTLIEHPEYFKHDASGKISTGEWHFPVLDFKCQSLREYLWANMIHWVKDFQVDGYRCDVGDMVPLDFWEGARERLEPIRPDVVILSEGQRAGDQVKAFDIDYGFSWYGATQSVFTHGAPASALRKIWEQQVATRPRGNRWMRYTENHDLVNDLLRADMVCSERGSLAMAAINFTIDGVPLLYNGQEIGDNSLQSIYARWAVRWEAACLPKAKQKLAFYGKLCTLRHTEPTLSEGQTVWLENNQPDSVVSFLRRTDKEEIVTVANLSNRKVKVQVTLPEGTKANFTKLVADLPKQSTAAGGAAWDFSAFGYFVGKHQR